MKAFIVMTMLMIPVISFAQDQMYSHLEERSSKKENDEHAINYHRYNYELSPGRELMKAGSNQLLGIGLGLGGTFVGTVMATSGTVETAVLGGAVIVVSAITSVALNISAWKHIKRAGYLMDQDRVSISGKGLSISLN